MKTFLKFLLPVVVLICGAFAAKHLANSRVIPQSEPPVIPRPIVTTIPAKLTDYRVIVSSQGTVIPRTESQMVVEVSGRVTFVSKSLISGGFFDEGEILLEIDPRDYELATAQAELDVARAQRRLKEEEADADVARNEWERMGEGEASSLTLHEPQIAEAKASLAAATAMKERALRDLERTKLLAPFGGRVRNKSVDLGQFVARGSAVAMLYATDIAEVRLPLPDNELEFLTLPFGAPSENAESRARVELSAIFAGKRRSWDARIVRTEGEIDMKTRMVMAVAQVEDPYGRKRPEQEVPLALGMFVDGQISGHVLENVMQFPRSALRDGEQLYALDQEDRLRFVPANVIRRERDRVILRAEIPEGTRVVVSPLEIVTNGMLVRDLGSDVADSNSVGPKQ
ncbi:MAG: RND family efflux transporter MFP subunit [Planctomycetota bacterium]|jgi:RND family efflux transporter MFP subunit